MDRGNLADLTAFVAVADRLSFRAAASQLGVTPSALSHSMRQLEERLGVRLLHRTTRSVSVTDAGLRLLERLRPAIDQIAGALEELNQERAAAHGAAADLCAATWRRRRSSHRSGDASCRRIRKSTWSSRWARRRSTSWRREFDAGIGPHERVPADMIAVRVMGPMKVVVVGAPSLFCAAAAAAHARRSRPPQLHSISAGGRRRRFRLAVRAQSQIAPDLGGRAGDGQRPRPRCSRGG